VNIKTFAGLISLWNVYYL